MATSGTTGSYYELSASAYFRLKLQILRPQLHVLFIMVISLFEHFREEAPANPVFLFVDQTTEYSNAWDGYEDIRVAHLYHLTERLVLARS